MGIYSDDAFSFFVVVALMFGPLLTSLPLSSWLVRRLHPNRTRLVNNIVFGVTYFLSNYFLMWLIDSTGAFNDAGGMVLILTYPVTLFLAAVGLFIVDRRHQKENKRL